MCLKFNPDILIVGVGYNDLLKSWDPGIRTQEPHNTILRAGLYASYRTRITQLILSGLQINPDRPEPFETRWVELEEYQANMTRIVETAHEMHLPLLLIHQPLRALKLGENLPRKGTVDNGMGLIFMTTGVGSLTEIHQLFNHYRETLFAVAHELNTPLLDLDLAFQGKEEKVFDAYDLVHYNPFGAKIVALSIKQELQRLNWLSL